MASNILSFSSEGKRCKMNCLFYICALAFWIFPSGHPVPGLSNSTYPKLISFSTHFQNISLFLGIVFRCNYPHISLVEAFMTSLIFLTFYIEPVMQCVHFFSEKIFKPIFSLQFPTSFLLPFIVSSSFIQISRKRNIYSCLHLLFFSFSLILSPK